MSLQTRRLSTIWYSSVRSKFLPKIYGEILIPQTVYDELHDSDAPGEVRAWLSTSPGWLRISSVTFAQDTLLDLLDRGERDAILLAERVKADRLIIDDFNGRREAVRRKLPVIGTLGILAEAARRNLLDLAQALAALQTTNFHAAPRADSTVARKRCEQTQMTGLRVAR